MELHRNSLVCDHVCSVCSWCPILRRCFFLNLDVKVRSFSFHIKNTWMCICFVFGGLSSCFVSYSQISAGWFSTTTKSHQYSSRQEAFRKKETYLPTATLQVLVLVSGRLTTYCNWELLWDVMFGGVLTLFGQEFRLSSKILAGNEEIELHSLSHSSFFKTIQKETHQKTKVSSAPQKNNKEPTEYQKGKMIWYICTFYYPDALSTWKTRCC